MEVSSGEAPVAAPSDDMLSLEKDAGSATTVLPAIGRNDVKAGAAEFAVWLSALVQFIPLPFSTILGEFGPQLSPEPDVDMEVLRMLLLLAFLPIEPNRNICFHFLSFDPVDVLGLLGERGCESRGVAAERYSFLCCVFGVIGELGGKGVPDVDGGVEIMTVIWRCVF